MAYVFYKFHICFSFIYPQKNKHTVHVSGNIKTLKHNVRTRLRLGYHDCKNLTRRITICVFVTFSDC